MVIWFHLQLFRGMKIPQVLLSSSKVKNFFLWISVISTECIKQARVEGGCVKNKAQGCLPASGAILLVYLPWWLTLMSYWPWPIGSWLALSSSQTRHVSLLPDSSRLSYVQHMLSSFFFFTFTWNICSR